MAIFAINLAGQEMYIGYYYGSVIFKDVTCCQRLFLTYEQHIIKLTRDKLTMWDNSLRKKLVDSDKVQCDMWIVPACSVPYGT